MWNPDAPPPPPVTPILKSKTFWTNVLGAAAQVVNAGALHAVNPIVGIVAQAALNVAIRLVTETPASITGR